jgi:hypothetical protein
MNIFRAGTVAFAAVPVTARLAALSSRRIISDISSYYAVHEIDLVPRSFKVLTSYYL